MNGPETLRRLNSEPHPLNDHPRIVALRESIRGLPVDARYRSRLYHSLYKYADQIVDRPIHESGEGWDDLEALQQVTLGDMNERWLQTVMLRNKKRPSLPKHRYRSRSQTNASHP